MFDAPIHVTDDAFEKTVLQSNLPIVVDFWAPWCGPCKVIGPIIEELGEEYKDKPLTGREICEARGIKTFYNSRTHRFSSSELRKRTYESELSKVIK